MLRKVFRPKRDDVTGDWRILHSKELYDLYSLPNIIRVIKSRTRWVGHVARIGERRSACRILWGILRERDHLEEDIGVCRGQY